MHQLQHAQFKMKSLLLPVSQLIEGAKHDLEKPASSSSENWRCHASHARPLVRRDLQQRRIISRYLGYHRIAQEPHQLPGKMRRIVPFRHEPVERAQGFFTGAARHRAHQDLQKPRNPHCRPDRAPVPR